MRVAYFGWDYHGFAVQETTGKTIESELFSALKKTRLIEDRESSNYHRCGRTDKVPFFLSSIKNKNVLKCVFRASVLFIK